MLIIRHPDTYAPEREYAFGLVLGDFLGLDWSACPADVADVEITMAGAPDGPRLTIADVLFATPQEHWLAPESLPATPLMRSSWPQAGLDPRLVEADVPVIYGRGKDGAKIVELFGGVLDIDLDVFGSIFFQLIRYEEIVENARDEHDRFPASASLAVREGFLGRPLVNEYLEILRSALSRLWPGLEYRRRTFRQQVSCDVDFPTHEPASLPHLVRRVGGDVVLRRDLGSANARLRGAVARRRGRVTDDPFYAFDWMMDLAENRDLRMAFYFIPGRTEPRYDGTYDIEEPWIIDLLRRIHGRGHEVGLHASYGTFRDPAAILRERDALMRACDRAGVAQPQWGGRQHFLRWRNPVTWRGWDEAGLDYDASLGYSRHAGFRCGTCYEYRVFDLLARRPLALRERPLTVMEMAVIDADGGPRGLSFETVERLRERCRMFGGDFNLLWHNSRLASRRQRRMYVQAI